MKKSMTFILAATLSVVSAQSMANTMNANGNYTVIEKHRTILTEATSSKTSAYQDALNILNNLLESSPLELKQELNVNTFTAHETNSINVKDGAYVTAQEYMSKDGQLQYKGVVNLDYQYLKRDNNS